MKQKVLFGLVEGYGDWEYAFLAAALQEVIRDKASAYEVKTLAVEKKPIGSIGGFTTLPDYGLEDVPADYAALVLIGGKSWRTEEAKRFVPLVEQAVGDGKVVGAICDATVFLGMNGFLNVGNHTSNMLEELAEAAGPQYTNKENYQHQQAVRDGKLVTANGTAYLEFAQEVLRALEAFPEAYIQMNHQFYKLGLLDFLKAMEQQ